MRRLLLNPTLAGVLAVLSAAAPVRADETAFLGASNLIFVEAVIEEEIVLCLLDTGATASAIDAALAERLGLERLGETEVEGTATTFRVDTVRVESLTFVGARFGPLEATAYDLSGLLAPEGRAVGMILGYDVLRSLILEIDFDNGRLVRHDEAPAWERALPLDLSERVPILVARLAGMDLRLRIDTGASLFATERIYLNVTSAQAKALDDAGALGPPVEQLSGVGAGGAQVDLPVHRMEGFGLGELDLGEAHVIVQPRAGYFAREDAVGFVSNNLLRRFGRVVFDYPGARLLLPE